MSQTQTGPLLQHLDDLLDAHTARQRTDRELLQRFAGDRDEAAFTALVQRHGRLVLGVCRRVLRHEQDAEDAFQATFLVLARKGACLRNGDVLGSWLHGIAYRIAMNVRRAAGRRRRREEMASTRSPEQPVTEAALRELQALLDAEVRRLPEKYRRAFVLCCLEGRSKVEAAAELGWREGTVSSRVARARALLQKRLAGRGVALSAVLCAVGVSPDPAPAASLAAATVKTALASAGQEAASGVSAEATALAAAALRGLGPQRWRAWLVVALTLGLLVGTGLTAYFGSGPRPPAEDKGREPGGPPAPQADRKQRAVDPDGEPLPANAVLRLGTLHLRHRNALRSLAFSPDGRILASGGWDTAVRLWDSSTGKELRQLPGPDKGVECIAFAPDGKTAAGGGIEGGWFSGTSPPGRKCGA
jgi:RNA polymerase sigma factor (sigma-70 family)